MKIRLDKNNSPITYVGGNSYSGFYYDIECKIAIDATDLELSIVRNGPDYRVYFMCARVGPSILKFVDLEFVESLFP